MTTTLGPRSIPVLLVVLIAGQSTHVAACPNTDSPSCPCHWEESVIPVYALTQSGPYGDKLTDLSPARSAADWERIITNAINIYREHSGLARRLRFAGHTNQAVIQGAIVVRADTSTCDSNFGWGSFWGQFPEVNLIADGKAILRKKRKYGGVCQTVNWDPRLLQEVTTPPYNKDPVNILIHEFGHALGFNHPDTDCDDPGQASVMNDGVPIWARHFARYDKGAFRAQYFGTQNPQGKTYQYNGGISWVLLGSWVVGGSSIWARPGTVTTHRHKPVFGFVDGGNGGIGDGTGKLTSLLNSTGTTFSILEQGKLVPTYNSPATVYAGDGNLRMYVLREYTTGGTDDERKEICYYESTDSGDSWGSLVCPPDPSNPSFQIMTRRDGLAVAFDWHTKNYIVLYNADSDPGINRISALVQPGPGSSLGAPVEWSLGHHSFSTPSIACRDSSATNRCVIAFSTADQNPFLRWVEGGITTAGYWSQTADLAQTGIPIDQSPSVVWNPYDSKFHVAIHQRYQQNSRVDTYYKTTSGTSWVLYWGLISSSGSFSAPTLTSTHPPSATGTRMFYFQYAE